MTSGKQVLELINNKEAKLSPDGKSILDGSGNIIAQRVTSKGGVSYFEALEDVKKVGVECIRVCLEWQYSADGSLKVCLEWGCKE